MTRHTHRDLGPTRLRHSGPAAFTRGQRKKHPNMHPEGHIQMQDHYERLLKKHKRDTEKYNKYLAEYAAWRRPMESLVAVVAAEAATLVAARRSW